MTTASECIIPGCPTKATNLVGPFACPKESRDEWLKVMPKKPDPLPEKLLVCERHFQPDVIQRTGSRKDAQGSLVIFKLGTPRLKPGAVPTIFPRFLDPVQPVKAKSKRPAVVAGSRSTKVFADYAQLPLPEKPAATILVSAARAEPDFAKGPHEYSVTDEVATKRLINRRTYCVECQGAWDGPCYEHVSPADLIYDKPPVPLAFSSLPDYISVSSNDTNNEDGLPAAAPEESVIAKETLRAGMLFGPLIAPLIPLEEVEEPPRYVLWSEETAEFQAYDLRDNYICNWMKFIRPTSDFAQVNLVAYQQKDHIYFFTVKEVTPETELCVFVKIASNCKVLDGWVATLLVRGLDTIADKKKATWKINNQGSTSDVGDHLLVHSDQFEAHGQKPLAVDCDEFTDIDEEDSLGSSSRSSSCYIRKGKPRSSSSELPYQRNSYAREAKNRRVSSQAEDDDGAMEYDAEEHDESPDEYGENEEDGRITDDDCLSEDDFEELEEFEGERRATRVHRMNPEERAERKKMGEAERLRAKYERQSLELQRYKNGEMNPKERAWFEEKRKRRQEGRKRNQERENARRRQRWKEKRELRVARKKQQANKPEEKKKKAPKKVKESVRPKQPTLTMEEKQERLRMRKTLERRGRCAKRRAEFARYKNNEMTAEERTAYDHERNLRNAKKKECRDTYGRIRRQYNNGEISLEEMEAFLQERKRLTSSRAEVKYKSHPHIDKAVDAVMNHGMSVAAAMKRFNVPGAETLKKRLIKAGFQLPERKRAKDKVSTPTSDNTESCCE